MRFGAASTSASVRSVSTQPGPEGLDPIIHGDHQVHGHVPGPLITSHGILRHQTFSSVTPGILALPPLEGMRCF